VYQGIVSKDYRKLCLQRLEDSVRERFLGMVLRCKAMGQKLTTLSKSTDEEEDPNVDFVEAEVCRSPWLNQ
jgi:hypothetical protein